jgi:hypothetical protein
MRIFGAGDRGCIHAGLVPSLRAVGYEAAGQ